MNEPNRRQDWWERNAAVWAVLVSPGVELFTFLSQPEIHTNTTVLLVNNITFEKSSTKFRLVLRNEMIW